MKQSRFAISKRLRSFTHAINGLKILIKEEHNARIHLMAAILVAALSVILQINHTEWIAILLCIGFVFLAETLNTIIENLCDFVSPQKHQQIKRIKDLSAAVGLIAAITAFTTACIIFIPRLLFLL